MLKAKIDQQNTEQATFSKQVTAKVDQQNTELAKISKQILDLTQKFSANAVAHGSDLSATNVDDYEPADTGLSGEYILNRSFMRVPSRSDDDND